MTRFIEKKKQWTKYFYERVECLFFYFNRKIIKKKQLNIADYLPKYENTNDRDGNQKQTQIIKDNIDKPVNTNHANQEHNRANVFSRIKFPENNENRNAVNSKSTQNNYIKSADEDKIENDNRKNQVKTSIESNKESVLSKHRPIQQHQHQHQQQNRQNYDRKFNKREHKLDYDADSDRKYGNYEKLNTQNVYTPREQQERPRERPHQESRENNWSQQDQSGNTRHQQRSDKLNSNFKPQFQQPANYENQQSDDKRNFGSSSNKPKNFTAAGEADIIDLTRSLSFSNSKYKRETNQPYDDNNDRNKYKGPSRQHESTFRQERQQQQIRYQNKDDGDNYNEQQQKVNYQQQHLNYQPKQQISKILNSEEDRLRSNTNKSQKYATQTNIENFSNERDLNYQNQNKLVQNYNSNNSLMGGQQDYVNSMYYKVENFAQFCKIYFPYLIICRLIKTNYYKLTKP